MGSQGRKRKSEDELLPFQKKLGHEMVTLFVGEKEARFTVHKEILCNKIPYFEKMFKGSFQEATTNEARFPEDDPQSFDVLVGWVYEGELRSLIKEEHADGEGSLAWSPGRFYALADKLCLPQLMDETIDMQRQWGRHYGYLIPPAELQRGYEVAAPGTPYWHYLALYCAYGIIHTHNWLLEDLSAFLAKAPDLNLEVMKILRENVGNIDDPDEDENCAFHTHSKDVPCP
ncbi:hypothetical protein LOCC1_G007065 [Lachnellula occidentalis]|uniref:BTB domain-containing protein n=1 Tax=Lachnellula occidentalis TaxID=215460 RepID=A0A8H8RMI9_9HELO|nr:hypothetical protein LOCC1_G007065 [Lachnellula occidentalis]